MRVTEILSCINLQVTILGRHEQDELLLLASDGLWDVLSNQVWLYPISASDFLPTTRLPLGSLHMDILL
jgi:Protein phosphatase 2C